MRLFYFVTDSFPAWRVDVSELFGRELKALGVDTSWSMRRDDAGCFARVSYEGQDAYVPFAAKGGRVLEALTRRLGEFASELFLFAKLLCGKRFDVIQVRDDRYSAGLFALIAARLRGSKFVYWVSFPFPENDLEKAGQSSGVRRSFLRMRGALTSWWLYRFMLRQADHVFVQSERMKQDIAAYGVSRDKMTPVPMGVPPRLFAWMSGARREIDEDKVVYLGTLARPRRLETLIEAFALVLKEFPATRLYMVGRGDVPADRTVLEELGVRLGIADSIVFTGFLPIEEAWAQAASAAVCVSPIYRGPLFDCGSPTKLYEYMAIGCPVVANDNPEQAQVLKECPVGPCVPWGAENFAKGICQVLGSPGEARAMSAHGPAWVAENRRYDRLAAQVRQQYQRLLGDRA
jgi:glycosyltransferase involved in cell wall biosynthesis